MQLKNLKVGLAITGSFCNFSETVNVIEGLLKEGVKEIIPIISNPTKNFDTRFYKRISSRGLRRFSGTEASSG